MTKTIYCKLFGTPQFVVNGQPLRLPYAKLNALVFYLLLVHSANREQLAGLLWSNSDDVKARKSLRNAIYQINKYFDCDWLISPHKDTVTLNPDIAVQSDVAQFQSDPSAYAGLYDELLSGFYIKDAAAFDHWLAKMRQQFATLFSNYMVDRVDQQLADETQEPLGQDIERLIALDPLNETYYERLMQWYQQRGQHAKAVETYYRLTTELKGELDITPTEAVQKRYEQSLQALRGSRTPHKQRLKQPFFGRHQQLAFIENHLHQFIEGADSAALLLSGALGVGKSSLLAHALDFIAEAVNVIEVRALRQETQAPLRIWQTLVRQLIELAEVNGWFPTEQWREWQQLYFPDFRQEHTASSSRIPSGDDWQLEHAILLVQDLLTKSTEHHPLVIAIDDCHWLDAASLSLLQAIISRPPSRHLLFLLTAQSPLSEALQQWALSLQVAESLVTIQVPPFSLQETIDFCHKIVPNEALSDEHAAQLYQQTDGVAFFVQQAVRAWQADASIDQLTLTASDHLAAWVQEVSPDDQALLTTIAYFKDGVSVSLLAQLRNQDVLTLLPALNRLVQRGFLTEEAQQRQVLMRLRVTPLGTFLYQSETALKQRVTHQQIAQLLEKHAPVAASSSAHWYALMYHYGQAKEALKAFEYHICYVESSLSFYHELFPVFEDALVPDHPLSAEQAMAHFNSLNQQLEKLREVHRGEPHFEQMHMRFRYMEGRYQIRHGQYTEGTQNMHWVLQKSLELALPEFTLHAYRQMIYFCIQTQQINDLAHYLERATDLATRNNDYQSIGVLLRLKGVYYMLCGDYPAAEKQFHESINTFMITEQLQAQHSIDLAASYNYLGEIRHSQGHYTAACDLFAKAISLCQHNTSLLCLSIFYTNIGIASFAQEDWHNAKFFLLKASLMFDKSRDFWRRPQLDAYLALIYLREAQHHSMLQTLRALKQHAKRTDNPRDLGFWAFAAATVKQYVLQQPQLSRRFAKVLPQTPHEYYEQAQQLLNGQRDGFELNWLAQLFEPTAHS